MMEYWSVGVMDSDGSHDPLLFHDPVTLTN